MALKALLDMSWDELTAERAAAKEQVALADYVEGLDAWSAATRAANSRLFAVNCEISHRVQEARNG